MTKKGKMLLKKINKSRLSKRQKDELKNRFKLILEEEEKDEEDFEVKSRFVPIYSRGRRLSIHIS